MSASDPEPVKDVQGDGRWQSMVCTVTCSNFKDFGLT